jgi:plasmid stabilization system protein ParE
MTFVCSKKAHEELDAIYNYILKKQKNSQNAVLVFNAIFDLATYLLDFPCRYRAECLSKNENIRFAVIWSSKRVYSIHENSIIILEVFNTNQSIIKLNKQSCNYP